MSVRVRLAATALAGLSLITTVAIAVTGMAGWWGPRRGTELFCALLLSACITGITVITAVLGHVLSPLAASYGLAARATFRAGPARGRHAREAAQAPAAAPERYAQVVQFPR